MKKRVISLFLSLVMCLTLLPTAALAEGDNIELTVNIQPLKISKEITISENATYTELKSKIEEELNVDFDQDGYGIYCPEARIYYHPSSRYYTTDETKTLKVLNFKDGYTVNLEKLSWTGTTKNPINVMGLNISGGVGACGSFYSGTSAEVDYDWNYSLKYITIRTETPITISGTAEDGVHIVINTGSSKCADLTINNVNMTVEKNACITLNTQAQLNLTLEGTNTLTSKPGFEYGNPSNAPAIELNQSNSYLKIDGTGSLTAVSTCEGYPGIGSTIRENEQNVKGVEINGGTIIATGGTGGAGILAKRIWIYGGNVTANGGLSAKSAFKIENATVTANSDTQVFSGILKPTLNGQYNAVASVNKDGTETEKYDETKGSTYKYFKVTPKDEVSLTVDEPQEYTYNGTAKAFVLPDDALDGFSVAYKQGENDITAPTNAGSYDVIITRAEDDTYQSYSKTITNGLVIKPKTVDKTIILTAPVKNATPQTSIETDEYTATVVWSPEIAEGGTFAKSTEYTATITIAPKTNYTVSGVSENGYILDGATSVTNAENSNVVTAVFSQTAGSSSGSATYTVTVKDGENGTVTASAKRASKGDTVTLTVKADDGYALETLTVTDSKGNKVEVTEKNGKYSFKMPASSVTVTAVFAKEKAPFGDVPEDSYFDDPVDWAVDKGITTGRTENSFDPYGACTRAQAVTFLWRAAGCPAPESTVMPFKDVPADAYYYSAVLWAVENGITVGVTAETFEPNTACSRAHIVAFLFRYAAVMGMDAVTLQELVSGYGDAASVPGYALSAFNWALAQGIVQGNNGNLMPHDTCTRAQIVTFLYRLLGK